MYTLVYGLVGGVLGGVLRSVLDPNKVMVGGICASEFEGYALHALLGLIGGLLVLFAGSVGGGVFLFASLSGYVLADIVDSLCVIVLIFFSVANKKKRGHV